MDLSCEKWMEVKQYFPTVESVEEASLESARLIVRSYALTDNLTVNVLLSANFTRLIPKTKGKLVSDTLLWFLYHIEL